MMLQTMSLTLAVADTAQPPSGPVQAPAAGNPGSPAPGTPIQSQTPAATSQPGAQGQGQAPGFGGATMLIWLLVLVLLVVFLFGGNRKEKKRRKEMLASIKKGDRVQTVGGIIGSIVEVRDNEVIVKVDENANTRLRFARSAINAVVESGES